jgi:NhaP-type Na+/H+ or K+/H+ antiporter
VPTTEPLSSEEIFLAGAVIFAVATACQVLAPKLRLPALILLLPAGFIAGQLFPAINGETLLGSAFSPVVNLVVALILFAGGIELSRLPLARPDRRIIHRFVWLGSMVTWGFAAAMAAWIIGLETPIAVLVGAIVIVSGPTVVGPLLEFAKPEGRLRRLLMWEGITVDPVGALIAVVVFQAVKTTGEVNPAERLTLFGISMLTGAVMGVIGIYVIRYGLRLCGNNAILRTQVLVGSVIAAAGVANAVAEDAGLVAALVMGMATPFVAREQLESAEPFFDVIVSMSIGLLFVTISAEVTPESLQGLVIPTAIMVVLLILVVRPLIAWVMTIGTNLKTNERLFLGWMAPRGIVAASSAASFSATLMATGVADADKLLPVVFMIIVGTVVVYGLTAVPVARALGVRAEEAEVHDADTPAAAK